MLLKSDLDVQPALDYYALHFATDVKNFVADVINILGLLLHQNLPFQSLSKFGDKFHYYMCKLFIGQTPRAFIVKLFTTSSLVPV